jgi:hypothetical protein
MSQPSTPDGTDPRIVSPSEDEQTVQIAFGQSTGRTYHTADCTVVERMHDPKEVAMSVAEWKGYSKCKRCDEREGGDGYEHPGKGSRDGPNASQLLIGIDSVGCIHVRACLLDGKTTVETGDIVDAGKSTVRRHAHGNCSCDHPGRTVEYDGTEWTPADEEGIPKHITGYAPVSSDVCELMRAALAREGVTADTLADVLGSSDDAVRRHARGNCDHTVRTPPVTFNDDTKAWERVEVNR